MNIHKLKRRTNVQMTKIVLLISFIILIGRLLYASFGAISHHQDKKGNQQIAPTEKSQPLQRNTDSATPAQKKDTQTPLKD